MTIIEPNKANYSYGPAVFMTLFLLASLTGVYIYFYSESVNLKHSIFEDSKNLQALQVSNAELKNQLYQITDLTNLDSIIESGKLVKDNKPEYIESKSEVLASN
jgi:hypothetical protein